MVKSKKFSWRQLKQIYVTNTKIRTIVGMKKIRNWLGKVRKRDKITKNFSSVQSLSVRERVKNEISSELFEMSDKRFERSFSQQCKNLVKVLIDIIACYWLAIPLLVLEALKFIFPKRKNVSGQLLLVTGAGGGLGRSISLRLADLGCNIAVVDINQETAESVAQELQKKGVRATAFKADISNYDEIKKLRNDVTNSMGKVDILINNAGLIPNMSTQMGPGFLEKMISVNVLGTIWVKFDIQRRSFKAWFFPLHPSDDASIHRANEARQRRSHRRHIVDVRLTSVTVCRRLFGNESCHQLLHGWFEGKAAVGKFGRQDKDHNRLPLLHHHPTGYFRFFESRVSSNCAILNEYFNLGLFPTEFDFHRWKLKSQVERSLMQFSGTKL